MLGTTLTKLYTDYCLAHPGFRKWTRRALYQLLARAYRRQDWTFMNYGYAPLDAEEAALALDEEDEADRYSIQLYHHVASAVPLAGRDVLEVGSGRGGGARYVHSRLGPRTTVGVDFSSQAVALCGQTHCVDGLSFLAGDAERLPLASECFDAVVNVESSHCYGSMDAFLGEVARVLRPGGHLLFADLRREAALDELYAQLDRSGLEIVEDEDITGNVIHARDLDSEARMAFIRERAPAWLVQPLAEFGAVVGSRVYEQFRTRETIYRRLVLRKPSS